MDYEHESETDSKNGERVEFRPPKGFTSPEGTEEKGEFDLVCTFRVKPDGMLCLTMLGDQKMPGYDGKEEKTETKARPDYKEYAGSVVNEMAGQTNPGSY